MPKPDSTTSNKNGRFPKLVFLGFFLPMAALLVVIGVSLAALRTEARIKEMIDYDSSRLHLVSGFLGAEVFGSLKHLRSISTESITIQALDSPDAGRLQALESSFLTLALRNPEYQQIRWIDESGIEQAKVIRDRGEPFVVARKDLQDKSDRYYFDKANVLLPGELYISRLDLNVENGQIEMPLRPVLRLATPVKGSGRELRGIIIINIDMNYLFNLVYTPMKKVPDTGYFLVNQQGVQLHGELEDIPGAEVGEQSLNFTQAHPKVWEVVLEDDLGNLQSPDGLWSWETHSPLEAFYRSLQRLPRHMVAFDQLTSNDFSLTFMAHRTPGALNDVRYENRLLISLGIIFILSVYCISLIFYLTGQTRARRAEGEAAYAIERAANMARTKELEERFHRLVEASSIGQVVVDGDGRIEISNPAAERMLGYEKGELEGLQVDALLPTGLQQKHVQMREQFMQAPEARRMGVGRELAAVRKDGSTVPVEVGLNPYSDHGRQLILASIIDLSVREGLR